MKGADFQEFIDKNSKQIPSLADWAEEARQSKVGRWFSEHPEAETQVATHIQHQGVNKTQRWLVQFYEFPYTRTTLADHAIKAGWWKSL